MPSGRIYFDGGDRDYVPESKREARKVIASNPQYLSVDSIAFRGCLTDLPKGVTVKVAGPEWEGTLYRNRDGYLQLR